MEICRCSGLSPDVTRPSLLNWFINEDFVNVLQQLSSLRGYSEKFVMFIKTIMFLRMLFSPVCYVIWFCYYWPSELDFILEVLYVVETCIRSGLVL